MTILDGQRPTVVIAGASGFVGRALAQRLSSRFHVVGLSRSPRAPDAVDGVSEWRVADLFSRADTEAALKGARYGIFLVHSMMRSARLTQGGFDELDMLAADNFARAATSAGFAQLVYLGGLVPERTDHLSEHLASRLEVERVLDRGTVPVTTLRAGMIVGPGGSSFEMMRRLVDRLPAMLLPRWTESPTQPVDLRDVVELIDFTLGRPETFGQTFDVGGPEVMSYRQMIERTAQMAGKSLRTWGVPAVTPKLSTLWISLVTGAPGELVAPLVQSLLVPTVTNDRRLQELAGVPGRTFEAAVEHAMAHTDRDAAFPSPPASSMRDVRSVQRLPLPDGRDAGWVADEYLRWLPQKLAPLLRVEVDEAASVVRFVAQPSGKHLLTFERQPRRSELDRALFKLTGGLLWRQAGARGRFEFRAYPEQRTALVALHDFTPRLPWWLYVPTQAVAHEVLMRAFARHLARIQPAPATKVTETPAATDHLEGASAS